MKRLELTAGSGSKAGLELEPTESETGFGIENSAGWRREQDRNRIEIVQRMGSSDTRIEIENEGKVKLQCGIKIRIRKRDWIQNEKQQWNQNSKRCPASRMKSKSP
ncbi:hypothetical protein EVAR_12323_1 [Eumeta japonica]|uniref:Uncharacterized protein n=1 Tax=Eumeta variegata TaxID=151549 RepID=A0A4C1TUE6_EUMVA|nr:hypothetical protein EVAR_12323_1 [Eumeta japonica]